MYSVLKWEYDNNKVEARSKDITNNRVECIMVTLKEFKEFINSLPDSYNDLRVCIGTSHVVLTPITTDYEIITENLYINCFEDY